MSSITGHPAPARVARITGSLCLAYFAAMVLANLPGHIRRGTAEHRHADPRPEGARA